MFNIIEYLESKNISYDQDGENVTKGWININCPFPFCGDPKNHLGINPGGTGFSCWMCGAGGKMWELISVIENCSEKEAKKIVYKYSKGNTFKKYIMMDKVDNKLTVPKGLTKEFPKIAIDYLKKDRKLNPEYVIKKYDLFWGGKVEYFKYRIVFPIKINDEVVTYVGRDVTKKTEIPYKNWPNNLSARTVKKSVFNIDLVQKKAIIVEGIFDAINIGDGCIALMGKTFTKDQIDLILSKKLDSIYIMLDSKQKDPEIQVIVNKLKNTLLGHIKHIEILELDKGDPGDLSEQEVFNIRKDLLF